MSPKCPHCEGAFETPGGQMIRASEFITGIDVVEESLQLYYQVECPGCEAILGYLGVGAVAGDVDIAEASSGNRYIQ